MYCNAPGLLQPTAECPAGFYCPQGTAEPVLLCSVGYHCPQGTFVPRDCMNGTFQDEMGQSKCKPCPPGYYCEQESNVTDYVRPKPCPEGHYCPSSTRKPTQFPCPVGKFNNKTRLETDTECTLCSSGMFCATTGLSNPTGMCAGSYYCLLAATTPTPVDGLTGDICPPGFYCPIGSGVPQPCPPGTYSAKSGASVVSDCEACASGSYCDDYGLTHVTAACLAGFYCVPATSLPTLVCPFGFHCPVGSHKPVQCPSGYYQNEVGKGDCKPCPAGYYCDLDEKCSDSNYTQPHICPPGHYCPPATKHSAEFPCTLR
eukprot:NODE_1071_length_1119_cov_117.414953_g820_i0.p1 GENE.NODE_1071_length_1119_cov_117.414953_g820_i0~~NODE_1071_length_1119_cov_117.414953_g820_i0.p1  ORF type:complete len:315 (-),score=41.32 NODE_1071_length_1119_cov_117.414953_g820_i0:16-960(-)